jgi:hypothetical protein
MSNSNGEELVDWSLIDSDPGRYVVRREAVVEFIDRLRSEERQLLLPWLQVLLDTISSRQDSPLSELDLSIIDNVIKRMVDERSEPLFDAIASACREVNQKVRAARLTVALMINLAMGCSNDYLHCMCADAYLGALSIRTDG